MSSPAPISDAQLAANRANAQLSTGPRSSEGKARVAMNGVKTALTGRTVLLPTDDAAAYQKLLDSFKQDFAPVGAQETALVQSLVDTRWRIERIPALEASLVAIGLADLQTAEQKQMRMPNVDLTDSATCEMLIRLRFASEFRNLQLQESRLNRRREKDLAELKALQAERAAAVKAAEKARFDPAARLCLLANHTNKPFSLSENGFAFSKDELNAYLNTLSDETRRELLHQAVLATKDVRNCNP